jgi:hypothetical protein
MVYASDRSRCRARQPICRREGPPQCRGGPGSGSEHLRSTRAHEHFNPTNLDFPLPRTCWTRLQPVLRVSTMEQTGHHLDSAAAAAMAADMDTIANALNLRSTPTPAIAPTPTPAPTVAPAPTPSPVPTAATAPMASSSPHATVPTASGNLVRWFHLFLLSEVISFSALRYLIILSFITIFTRASMHSLSSRRYSMSP